MKYLLSIILLVLLTVSVAVAEESILIQGRGEGFFCGVEEGDYIHVCVQQDNEKRSLLSGLEETDAARLAKLKLGDKMTFQFVVLEATLPEAEKKMVFPVMTKLETGNTVQSVGLGNIFATETLGMAIPYLESKIGPAKYVSDSTRTYDIDGCNFQVVGKDTINSMRLELSPQCTFNIQKVFGKSGEFLAHKLTFGTFHELAGGGVQYMADCLSGCGNAYDPSVYAFYQGPRSLGGIEIKAQGLLVDDVNIKAADRFADYLLQKEGEDWLGKTMINCDRKYDQEAQEFLRTVKVTAIEIGVQVYKPECDKY